MTLDKPCKVYKQQEYEHCLDYLARLQEASAQEEVPWTPEYLKAIFWQGLARPDWVKNALGLLFLEASSAESLAHAFLAHIDTDEFHSAFMVTADRNIRPDPSQQAVRVLEDVVGTSVLQPSVPFFLQLERPSARQTFENMEVFSSSSMSDMPPLESARSNSAEESPLVGAFGFRPEVQLRGRLHVYLAPLEGTYRYPEMTMSRDVRTILPGPSLDDMVEVD